MHTTTYPQLIPLVILIPALGAFINIFWGARLRERVSGWIGIGAALISFFISLLIVIHLHDPSVHGAGSVVNPAGIFDSWIRIDSIGLDIPWQFRVDPVTATMLMIVTGIGSLIHIYSMGYMHGDPKFSRFFAYLNMFLMFMLILVTANNFLMLFVGWEGVGVMSYLLIGFWWDKGGALGRKNANAARKAMIVNRVGDFGILMAVFLIFWTFGTLDFYRPGETANVCYAVEVNHLSPAPAECAAEHGAEETHTTDDETHEEVPATGAVGTDDHGATPTDEHGAATDDHATTTDDHGATTTDDHATTDDHGAATDDHGETVTAAHETGDEAGHGSEEGHAPATLDQIDNSRFEFKQLGVFGQTARYMELPEDAPERQIELGPFKWEFRSVLFLIVLFMLLGVTGKSAQIPLFVWLPDAMAGPTPVSALMHAATMVTAGVFLLIRSNVFLDYVEEARLIITIVGAFTALIAGFMAVGQWDIKRVLAFSTISQLGFMVAAVGLGAYVAALFHLLTHAVFKALLFLGSGSVIHGVEHGHHHAHAHAHDTHGEEHGDSHAAHDEHTGDSHGHDAHAQPTFDPQDMRNMGGLFSRMPITAVTYLIGTFALAGLPFFAGFWSKDEILGDAFNEAFFGHSQWVLLAGQIALAVLLAAAGMTAFYMWRQVQMVFFGDPRTEAAAQAPESVSWMTIPLVILAFFSFTIGFINVPANTPIFSNFLGLIKDYEFKHFLETAIPSVTAHEALSFNVPLAIVAVALAFVAIAVAHNIYGGNKAVVNREAEIDQRRDPLNTGASGPAWRLANARLYWDETYFRLFENPYNRISQVLYALDWNVLHDYFHDSVIGRGYRAVADFLARPFDQGIIDGVVNGVARVVRLVSGRVRGVQTGYVRTYAVALLLGVVAVVIVMLLPWFTR